MPSSPTQDRLRARVERTLSELGQQPHHALPTGPVPLQQAALDAVLDHVPAPRAEDLIEAYGSRHLRACVHDVMDDPRVLHLLRRPLATLPHLQRALSHLQGHRPAMWPEALLTDHADHLSLHQRNFYAPSLPPLGLWSANRQDLLARLDAGTPPDVLLDQLLGPSLVHELARGPARGWTGGWPCWTLLEAAVTHVHRRCAPQHIFPDTPGGALGGYRHFAMIGGYLSLWLDEPTVWQLAGAMTHPHEGLGARLGTVLALADLQAWILRGGANLGPAFSDPITWLKLLSAAMHGGPLDALLNTIGAHEAVGWELAQRTPDLLQAAAALTWQELPVWRGEASQAEVHDLLHAATAAMFAEDMTLRALYGAPSDPPGGVLRLDVGAATLSARPRAHHQYTEPASWLLPPPWCAALHRRGLRQLRLTGCRVETREAVLQALLDLGDGPSALPEDLHLDVAPRSSTSPITAPTPPAARQLRHHDPMLAIGCGLSAGLAQRLREGLFDILPSPFGVLRDPLCAARSLRWCCGAEPFPYDLLSAVEPDGPWISRWHDPAWRFPNRTTAFAALDAGLAGGRAQLRRQKLILLTWDAAWVHTDPSRDEVVPHPPGPGSRRRLLEVEQIVLETTAALQQVAQHAGPPRVALAIHPATDPDLDVADNQAGKAVLLLAARQLAAAGLVELFPSWETVREELRDHVWYAPDGHALAPQTEELLFDRFLDGWACPATRTWTRTWRTLRSPGPEANATRATLSAHPLLPQPAAPAPAPEAPPITAPNLPSDLEALLQPGAFIDAEVQLAWSRQVDQALEELPPLPEGTEAHERALRALADKADDVDDVNVVAVPYARLLQELIPKGRWLPDTLAPLLRLALTRHWLDDLDDLFVTIGEARRLALGQALLGDGPALRKGQLPRTPFQRCLVVLLGPPG